MKEVAPRLVCPQHDRCESPRCGDIIGDLPAVGHRNTETGKETLFHVMCAPPALRKAYHEGQHVR